MRRKNAAGLSSNLTRSVIGNITNRDIGSDSGHRRVDVDFKREGNGDMEWEGDLEDDCEREEVDEE